MKKTKLQQFLRRGTSLLLAGALLFGSTPAAFASTGDDPAQPTEIISDEKPTEEITEDDLTKEEETETTEEIKEETTEETTNDEIIDEETDQETTEETETDDLTAEATNLLTTTADGNTLLTEPFLQLPEANSVHVVWFTEFESAENKVLLYEDGADAEPTREITAETSQLSRIRGGKTDADKDDPTIEREIWRHEAVVDGLPTYHGEEEERVPYQVVSDGVESGTYTLQAQAQPGTDMKILLTSDIQTKNMCAANIQKVSETVGQIDAILANGDIIDVPDRSYDWFDADSSFFRVMQGTTDREIGGVEYNGAALMQNAPTYASIGNHEVMGRYSETSSLSAQFNDPTTRAYAEDLYEERNNDQDPNNDIAPENKEQFIEDNSFNTTTWEEVLTLPESETGDERYYAVTIGDVRVIVLEVARIWRNNTVGGTSKYSEIPEAAESQYGFGQHIFEPIGEGSDQLAFLEEELQSDEFQNAKYKMVMFHWQFHSLGGNQIPAYTDPQPSTVELQDGKEMTIYEYPLAEDYLKNNVEPLLEEYNVDFVFNAHSHLWNRFQTDSGMNILETSNNGNTYNAFLDTKSRTDAWPSALNEGNAYAYLADNWDKADYPLQGDPYGLSPIMPNVAELPGGEPYLMSNTITAFSVLDTAKGTVDSYYFDTEDPDSEVVLFDSFSIQRDSKENYELAENDVLSKIGSYATGYSDQEGGVAEIVAYNKENEKFYLVNGREQKLDIVSLADLKSSGEQTLSLEKRVDVSAMIEGFSFGDITSVAVDTNHNRIAVAVQAAAYDQAGAILLLDYDGNYIAHYAAGVQPDMVTFSPDGNYVLSANEGEPREGYEGGATDPQGSVTVVDLSAETPAANTIDFTAWDSQRADLLAENVILKQGLNPSTDFEPEYIAVDSASKTAYVALQEANAIATLDLASGTFTDISSLGFKNHLLDNNEIDAIKDDSINIKWENLRGVYMPDGIAITETNGKTYLLTANEGDASEWGDYANITEVEINGETVEVLDSSKLEGLPEQSAGAQYILGGRSFSIYEVTANGLEQVYDSGSDFEKITAKAYPDYFNASNKNNNLDSRSDAKGPEPESVAVNQVGNKTYAYIGLERIGGVMLYDITDPTSPVFCDYINSRDFTVDFPDTGTAPEQGDVSVEGMAVVAAKDSPTGYPLLLAANEVSGTVAVYQQNEGRVNQGGGGGSSSSSSGNAITSSSTSNGKISISPARAEEGDTVTITVTPDAGYQLDQLTVTDADGNTIRTNNQGDGKYTFTMPDSRVTVQATFSQSNGTEPPSTELPFQDVAAGSWYADAVAQAYEEGWMNGTSAAAFSPNSEITRGMIVTILHRLEQTPAAEAASFADVATGSYYADAVAWAAANGIVKGYSESQFGPNDPITREQLATILYNYANHKGYETTASADLSSFGDASQISAYAQTALQWANGAGIINGMADNTLQPQGSATRAEAATMLVRFQSNIAQ